MKGYRILVDFARDRSAAVAPMYAIALFGLIMIAGVGWDYSRLMTMDSELQNAADQAALAAATQLTGVTGAIDRAELAATTYFTNETKLATDDEGRAIGVLSFEFFESWNHVTDEPGPETDEDAEARYVRVTVDGREVDYYLTAIGGVLSSGDINARAVATLESAACNIPPLMLCAPSGNSAFPTTDDIGIALDLREMPQNSSEFTPGNFDLLDIDYENLANNQQNISLGLNSDLLGCTASQLTTAPGRRTTQDRALNTRFGIYEGGSGRLNPESNGNFRPAEVTRSDLVRAISRGNLGNTPADICNDSSVGVLGPPPTNPPFPQQGLPLDTCQTLGLAGCGSFGDGNWPLDTYMNNIHGVTSASVTGLDADGDGKITRYEVYNWERAVASRNAPRELARVPNQNGNGGTVYCSAPRPVEGTPVLPSATQKDRRVVTVAVVDCAGQSGRFEINTFKFIDLFLLGPIATSGGLRELRAEIIGPARRADGGSGFQTFGRKKAVLVQ